MDSRTYTGASDFAGCSCDQHLRPERLGGSAPSASPSQLTEAFEGDHQRRAAELAALRLVAAAAEEIAEKLKAAYERGDYPGLSFIAEADLYDAPAAYHALHA